LTDLDQTAAAGTAFEVCITPFARVLGKGGREQRGSFGLLALVRNNTNLKDYAGSPTSSGGGKTAHLESGN
jgi:hypothetical protein